MLIIRKARAEDAPAILAITKAAFTDYQNNLGAKTPQTSALKETVDNVIADIMNNCVYCAEDGGVILGSIRYKKLSGELIYVYRFGVNPEIKNNGVGSELLGKAISDCVENNINAIALHTNAKYFKLARYYYGKEFYVHSTSFDKGYIRALFVKEVLGPADLSPAFIL